MIRGDSNGMRRGITPMLGNKKKRTTLKLAVNCFDVQKRSIGSSARGENFAVTYFCKENSLYLTGHTR